MTKLALTYAGKRRNALGRVWHLFVDAKGKEYTFGGRFKWVFIGHTYEAEKKDDGGVEIKIRPDEVQGHRPSEEQVDQWRAIEKAQENEAKEMKTRERLDGMKGLLEDIPRIKHAVRGLRTHTERASFLNWLLDEIERENREAMNRELNARLARITKNMKRKAKVKK